MKTVLLFLTMSACLWAQSEGGNTPVEKAKPEEAPIRGQYEVYDYEQAMGCFTASSDVGAKIATIDCSRAMPFSPRDKTIRSFCVVLYGERLVGALVATKTRALMRCDVARAK